MALPSKAWTVHAGSSGGGLHLWLCSSERKPDVLRLIYRTDQMGRYKLGPVVSEDRGKIMLEKLRYDQRQGSGVNPTLHMIRTAHREQIKPRLTKHRQELRRSREMAAIRQLPSYGLF